MSFTPQFTLIKGDPRRRPVAGPYVPPSTPEPTARELADWSLTDHLLAAEKRDEEHGEAINAAVKAKWLSLSRPEPKSIYSPAPPSPVKREERKNWPPGALSGTWYNRGAR